MAVRVRRVLRSTSSVRSDQARKVSLLPDDDQRRARRNRKEKWLCGFGGFCVQRRPYVRTRRAKFLFSLPTINAELAEIAKRNGCAGSAGSAFNVVRTFGPGAQRFSSP